MGLSNHCVMKLPQGTIFLLVLHILLCTMASGTLFRSKSVIKRSLRVDPSKDARLKDTRIEAAHWSLGDDLDKRILALALPAMANFIVFPLVGAVDTFWVGQMHNPLALAGLSASTQVYNSCNWLISFFPAVVTPLVVKASASGDKELVQQRVGESLIVALFVGIMGTLVMSLFPNLAIQMVLSGKSNVQPFALPYLRMRTFCILPSLLSTVAFSTFRGTFDVVEPLKISAILCLINAVLDPFLIFNANQGVVGVATAKVLSELVACCLYLRALTSRNLVDWSSVFKSMPSLSSLYPLISGGLNIQMRSIVLNFAYLTIARSVQSLDESGTSAAAHAIIMQIWQVGLFSLIAMATVSGILVPSALAKARSDTSLTGDDKLVSNEGRAVANRLLCWGLALGVIFGGVQIASIPLLKWFTNSQEVQQAALMPSIISAAVQVVNGFVVVGEGIQQGNQCYISLTVSTALSTAAMLASLRLFGSTLEGVWISTGVLNVGRMIGVLVHHFILGPMATAQNSVDDSSSNSSSSKKST